MLTEPPVLLPPNSLVLLQNPALQHPRGHRLVLSAMTLPGILSKVKAYRQRLPSFSLTLQYGPHIRNWLSFCLTRKINPFEPPLNILLDYLFAEFNKVKGRSYSSMNTIRSATSAVANINGQPVGKHPLITRFMKAVLKSSFFRCQTTWDPQLVLDYIVSLDTRTE